MSSNPDWPPGTRVVCINDDPIRGGGLMDGLRAGVVYAVREIYFDQRFMKPLVRLQEIYRPLWPEWELGYNTDRFERLPERKTDISIFTQMLTGVPIKEMA